MRPEDEAQRAFRDASRMGAAAAAHAMQLMQSCGYWDEGTREAAIRRISREPFPSLSLMTLLPARNRLPRGTDLMAVLHGDEEPRPLPARAPRPTLRWFPGGPGHVGKWRCALRSQGSFNVTGWGSTHNRAWNAWVDAWCAGHPETLHG